MSVAITLADTGMSIFSLSTTCREGDVEEKDDGERLRKKAFAKGAVRSRRGSVDTLPVVVPLMSFALSVLQVLLLCPVLCEAQLALEAASAEMMVDA
jgi:hypothetical protein